MITAELTRKIDLLPQESYRKVENYVDQLFKTTEKDNKNRAFKVFMAKMEEAEQSVREQGVYTEEEVEAELAKI